MDKIFSKIDKALNSTNPPTILNFINKILSEIQTLPKKEDRITCHLKLHDLFLHYEKSKKVKPKKFTCEFSPMFMKNWNMNEAIEAYKKDIIDMDVWGGLTEAAFLAKHILAFKCNIYKTGNNNRLVKIVEIGSGNWRLHGSYRLHLHYVNGNHFQVVKVPQNLNNNIPYDRYVPCAIPGDNSCLFRSMLVINNFTRYTLLKNDYHARPKILRLRQYMVGKMPEAVIANAILEIVWNPVGIGRELNGVIACCLPESKTIVKLRGLKTRGYECQMLKGSVGFEISVLLMGNKRISMGPPLQAGSKDHLKYLKKQGHLDHRASSLSKKQKNNPLFHPDQTYCRQYITNENIRQKLNGQNIIQVDIDVTIEMCSGTKFHCQEIIVELLKNKFPQKPIYQFVYRSDHSKYAGSQLKYEMRENNERVLQGKWK